MSLRAKANLLFVAGTLVLLLIASLALRAAAHADAVQQAGRQAELLTADTEIAGRYTADKVAPLLSDGGRGQLVFVPASAPFFASQTQAGMLHDVQPGVSIRQVALNPVGASDRPTEQERKAIERMRSEAAPAPYTIEHDGPDGPLVSLVSPLLFFPGACATCYTSRAAAPPGVLDAFGGAGGFNNKPGEVVGATVATVALPSSHVSGTAITWMIVLALVLLGLFNLVLELLVLRPLGRVAAVAERVSLGQTGVEEFDTAGRDEIGSITRSFNRLRRSMESAIGLIES